MSESRALFPPVAGSVGARPATVAGGVPGAAGLALPPILVADDDHPTRRVVGGLLRRAGLANPVVEAPDGDAAVEILARATRAGEGWLRPALVILDLQMPGRSGLEVLRWMVGEGDLAGTPTILLTATAELEQVQQAEAMGASSYLVKPVGFPALVDVVRRLPSPWALLRDAPGG